MEEYFDMYDQERHPLWHTHLRGVPIPEGEYHIVVQVCVLDACGQMLLTKRHPDKTLGGLWEVTAGSVLAGENAVEGALRELFEETGLKLKPEDLSPLYSRRGDGYFLDSFVVHLACGAEEYPITLQEGETVDFVWAGPEKLEQMEKEGMLVPIAREALKYFG